MARCRFETQMGNEWASSGARDAMESGTELLFIWPVASGVRFTATREWALLRLAKLRSTNWRCEQCGKYAREVHHRVPLHAGGPALPGLDGLRSSVPRVPLWGAPNGQAHGLAQDSDPCEERECSRAKNSALTCPSIGAAHNELANTRLADDATDEQTMPSTAPSSTAASRSSVSSRQSSAAQSRPRIRRSMTRTPCGSLVALAPTSPPSKCASIWSSRSGPTSAGSWRRRCQASPRKARSRSCEAAVVKGGGSAGYENVIPWAMLIPAAAVARDPRRTAREAGHRHVTNDIGAMQDPIIQDVFAASVDGVPRDTVSVGLRGRQSGVRADIDGRRSWRRARTRPTPVLSPVRK